MSFRDEMAAIDAAVLSALGEAVPMATDAGIPLGTITGLFDFDYIEISGVEGYRPLFVCRATDVPPDCHGYRLTYDGTTYRVKTQQKDGSGMMTLVLEAL